MKIRWGIIGTGSISNQFAVGLRALPDAQLLAVSSRRPEAVQQFAAQFGVPHPYIGHQQLVQDPDVDVVYIGTPHTTHKQIALDCIEAGKAVLVEKPFTVNAQEAQIVIAKAREKGVFCMEAMWMRFIPLMQAAKQTIAEKTMGERLLLKASLSFRSPYDPQNRFFNLALGGGSLLDLGVYPINLAFWLLGQPDTITSYAHIGQTGVDEMASVTLGYENGSAAILSCSNRVHGVNRAVVEGEYGRLQIHEPIYSPTRMNLEKRPDQSLGQTASSTIRQRASQIEWLRKLYGRAKNIVARFRNSDIYIPFEGNGYNYEAAEVQRCLQSGKLESDIMPLDETLSILIIMDKIREQWNLRYPMENPQA